MKQQVIQRAIALVERRAAPDKAVPYWNADIEDVTQQTTGYEWQWVTPGGFMIIKARLKPEKRLKHNRVVTLEVAREDITIVCRDAASNLGFGGTYELSFVATHSSLLPTPIIGLEALLRSALKVPVPA